MGLSVESGLGLSRRATRGLVIYQNLLHRYYAPRPLALVFMAKLV